MQLEDLKKEIRATALGQQLLDFLDSHDIKIVITDKMPLSKTAGGVYSHKDKTIYLREGLSPSHLLFIFAHETRHAAQFSYVRLGGGLMAFPAGSVFTQLAIESDADVFALYYLFDRAMKLQNDGAYFDVMRKPDALDAVQFDRHAMMQSFLGAYQEKRDVARALRHALQAWLETDDLVKTYIAYGIDFWRETTFKQAQKHADLPNSEFARAFRKALRQRTPQTEEKNFYKLLRSFHSLPIAQDMPDYLQGVSSRSLLEVFSTAINQNSPAFESAFAREEERFEKTRQHYMGKSAAGKSAAGKSRRAGFN